MSTAVVMERIRETSPRFKARIAGFFYLLTIVARMFVEIFVRNRLVVSDDAAATATNIMAHEQLFRLGFAADIMAFASYIALTALLTSCSSPWIGASPLSQHFSASWHPWCRLLAACFISLPCSCWGVLRTCAYLRWTSCRRWRSYFSDCAPQPITTSAWYFSDCISSWSASSFSSPDSCRASLAY